MNPWLSIIPLVAFFSLQIVAAREWKQIDGSNFEAEPFNKTDLTVTIRLKNGTRKEIPIARLSFPDQKFVKSWTPARPLKASEKAVFFNGSWYEVILHQTSHQVAEAKAKELGGHLAWIKDEKTQIFITKLANRLQLWIGGSDEETEGLWKWGDGSEFEYKNWARGQPNNYRGKEHVIHIKPYGKWNDNQKVSRNYIVGYIVQWDM